MIDRFSTRWNRDGCWKATISALPFAVLLSVMATGLFSTSTNLFAAPASLISGSTPQEVAQVEIGFGGKIVLGRWVPITIRTEADISDGPVATIEVLDGDAVPVRYTLMRDTNSNSYSGLVRFGRATGITIEIADTNNELVFEKRLSLEDVQADHSFLSGTTRLLMMIGLNDLKQVDSVSLKREQFDDFVVIDSPQQLPDHHLGFDSIRMVAVLPNNADFIKGVKTQQATALTEWVAQGAHVLLTSGKSSIDYFGPDSPLKDLVPGTLAITQEIRDTGAIELLTKSNDPLVNPSTPPLNVLPIQADDPASVLASVGDLPLLLRSPYGFGSVSICTVDFTSAPLNQWTARNELLAIALGAREAEKNVGIKSASGRVSHIGYEDMSGQLRASLDQFTKVSFITFTSVALLVALFILLIGPGDYFFLRKATKGRMQLTWLTSSLLALLFCGLAWYLNSRAKSNQVELNQVEIIDIVANDGRTRGIAWAHLYSPSTGNYTIKMAEQNSLTGPIQDHFLAWQGLPGSGLGSMQSRSELGLYRKPYKNDDGLEELPLQNAATKTMVSRWNGNIASEIRSNLRQSPNSDALLGSFTNPLDVKLYDCILLYGDWVYVLENRALEPLDDLLVEDDLRETTVKGHFTRTSRSSGDKKNAAWSPSNVRPSEILQMMGFFDAIGGETYTRLTNNFHSEIDLSHQLEMGNAILVGQVGQVTTPLSVNGKAFDRYDKKLSLVRIVFPVKPREQINQ